MRSTPLSKNINTISFQHHQASKYFVIIHFSKTLDFKPKVNLNFKPSALDFKPTASFIVKTLDFNPRVFLPQTWILNQVPWTLNQWLLLSLKSWTLTQVSLFFSPKILDFKPSAFSSFIHH